MSKTDNNRDMNWGFLFFLVIALTGVAHSAGVNNNSDETLVSWDRNGNQVTGKIKSPLPEDFFGATLDYNRAYLVLSRQDTLPVNTTEEWPSDIIVAHLDMASIIRENTEEDGKRYITHTYKADMSPGIAEQFDGLSSFIVIRLVNPSENCNGEDEFCFPFDAFVLNQSTGPKAKITYDIQSSCPTICRSGNLNFSGAESTGSGELTYKWLATCGATDIPINPSDQETAVFAPNLPTHLFFQGPVTCKVVLSVTDETGRQDSAVQDVSVVGTSVWYTVPSDNFLTGEVCSRKIIVLESNAPPTMVTWTQEGGPNVTLVPNEEGKSSFEAPLVNAPTELKFRAVIQSGGQAPTCETELIIKIRSLPQVTILGPDLMCVGEFAMFSSSVTGPPPNQYAYILSMEGATTLRGSKIDYQGFDFSFGEGIHKLANPMIIDLTVIDSKGCQQRVTKNVGFENYEFPQGLTYRVEGDRTKTCGETVSHFTVNVPESPDYRIEWYIGNGSTIGSLFDTGQSGTLAVNQCGPINSQSQALIQARLQSYVCPQRWVHQSNLHWITVFNPFATVAFAPSAASLPPAPPQNETLGDVFEVGLADIVPEATSAASASIGLDVTILFSGENQILQLDDRKVEIRLPTIQNSSRKPVLYFAASDTNWTPVLNQQCGQDNTITAHLTEAGRYQVFLEPTQMGLEFGEVYVFPNPSRTDTPPILHVEVNQAADVSARIYDVSNELVAELKVDGNPQFVNGKTAYEKALAIDRPGVFSVMVTAQRSGAETIRKKTQFTFVK